MKPRYRTLAPAILLAAALVSDRPCRATPWEVEMEAQRRLEQPVPLDPLRDVGVRVFGPGQEARTTDSPSDRLPWNGLGQTADAPGPTVSGKETTLQVPHYALLDLSAFDFRCSALVGGTEVDTAPAGLLYASWLRATGKTVTDGADSAIAGGADLRKVTVRRPAAGFVPFVVQTTAAPTVATNEVFRFALRSGQRTSSISFRRVVLSGSDFWSYGIDRGTFIWPWKADPLHDLAAASIDPQGSKLNFKVTVAASIPSPLPARVGRPRYTFLLTNAVRIEILWDGSQWIGIASRAGQEIRRAPVTRQGKTLSAAFSRSELSLPSPFSWLAASSAQVGPPGAVLGLAFDFAPNSGFIQQP